MMLVLARVVLLLVVMVDSVSMDADIIREVLSDPEKTENYFHTETITSESKGRVVIATHNQTSSMQCRHRCNLDNQCVDAVMKPDNVCLLLKNGSLDQTIPATVEMRSISKVSPGRIHCS